MRKFAVHFIGLIKELFERSFKSDHFKAGFKGSGVQRFIQTHTLNSLHTHYIRVSFCHCSNTTSDSATTVTTVTTSVDGTTSVTISEASASTTVSIKCACGKELTPIKLHVSAYLTKYMKPREQKQRRDNRRVKPTVYGEVLTKDEILERLEAEEKEKSEKAATKRANKEERAERARKKAAEKEEAKQKKAAEKAQKAAVRAAEKERRAAEKKKTVARGKNATRKTQLTGIIVVMGHA